MAATTLATAPTYVVPNVEATLTFTLGETGANYARIWCTAAPAGSKLRKLIDESTQSRVELFTTDAGSTSPIKYTFEKGGAYTLVSQEYTRGASVYGGGYENSADSAPSETKVGSEHTITHYVGQRMTSKVGAGANTATLVVWVWNATIRKTTLFAHKEASPTIEKPSSPSAAATIDASAVVTALANLVDVAVSTAVGTVATIVSEMITKINAHEPLTTSATHANADNDNAIALGYATATTPADLVASVSAILLSLRRHYTNDNVAAGTGAGGVDSADYHHPASAKVNDYLDAPLFRSVGSLEEAYRALADIWRSYEAHRVSTAVHGAADSTNTLTTLPKLLLVHKAVFDVLAAASPTTPPTQSSGAMLLLQQAGFTET